MSRLTPAQQNPKIKASSEFTKAELRSISSAAVGIFCSIQDESQGQGEKLITKKTKNEGIQLVPPIDEWPRLNSDIVFKVEFCKN